MLKTVEADTAQISRGLHLLNPKSFHPQRGFWEVVNIEHLMDLCACEGLLFFISNVFT